MHARILGPGDEAMFSAAAETVEDKLAPERARQLLADPCFLAVVALEDGGPVGLTYAHVLPQLTRTAMLIYSVDTAEPHRRRGAARAMINELKSLCLVRGYYEMWVATNTSNDAAMALYAACGGVREDTDEAILVFPTPI
jgi:GNAT superfamily N-acetyltransferase